MRNPPAQRYRSVSGPARDRLPSRSRPRRSIGLLVCALMVWMAPAQAGTGFDINTADAAALAAELPGIGPVKAERIVAHRRAHGPFADLDSLIAVPGIGPKTLEGIRRHLGGIPPPSRDARGEGESGGVREPPTRDERGARGEPAGTAPPRSSGELEAEARRAVRALIELARTDAAAARRGEPSGSLPSVAVQ